MHAQPADYIWSIYSIASVSATQHTWAGSRAYWESEWMATTVIVVDVQYDFCPPDGALAVPDGLEVVPVINELLNELRPEEGDDTSPVQLVYSQDWHPPGHVSFHSTHVARDPSASLFDQYELASGQQQTLWPDHCVQGTEGAKLHHDLIIKHPHVQILKGCDKAVDSYSAFLDVDGLTSTGLREDILRHMPSEREDKRRILVVGLALDYCVGYTALDAKQLFPEAQVMVLLDACRGVAPASEQDMNIRLREAGVILTTTDSL